MAAKQVAPDDREHLCVPTMDLLMLLLFHHVLLFVDILVLALGHGVRRFFCLDFSSGLQQVSRLMMLDYLYLALLLHDVLLLILAVAWLVLALQKAA